MSFVAVAFIAGGVFFAAVCLVVFAISQFARKSDADMMWMYDKEKHAPEVETDRRVTSGHFGSNHFVL
jgi:hypothetical protein